MAGSVPSVVAALPRSGNKEALMKLYDDTAAKRLGTYLFRIVTVAEPAIDRHISVMPV